MRGGLGAHVYHLGIARTIEMGKACHQNAGFSGASSSIRTLCNNHQRRLEEYWQLGKQQIVF
jgi:hypothetical protein